MNAQTLLAVPNVSEGRDRATIDAVARAFDARLLDVHSDVDHHRSVYTVAGRPGQLAPALVNGARSALERIRLDVHQGAHPRVGVLDVAPIVYLEDADRGAAIAEALVLGDSLGDELELPVLLYGALAGGRSRSELRRGGPQALGEKFATGKLRADFGPSRLHPTGGAVLVAARPPLIAFNVELEKPAPLKEAQEIAARIREGGPEGLISVRAIGVWLSHRGVAQVSTNLEDYRATPPARVIEAIRRHAKPANVEVVGLVPRAAFEGFPDAVPVRGLSTIEDALADNRWSLPDTHTH